MTRKVLKHGAWAGLVACSALSACSGPAAIPDGYVNSQAQNCNNATAAQPLTAIGTENPGTYPTTVTSGNDKVTLQCTISGGGGGFSLQLYAHGGGGTTIINGSATTNGSSSLTATFEDSMGNSYSQTNCTLNFKFMGMDPPANISPIAAGQIYGHVECLAAPLLGAEIDTPDGGSESAHCDIESDILFQNCTE